MAEFDGEDPRRPARGKTSGAAFRGSSGRVRRRGGRGRTCGALGGVGEARGGWWPRRTASVATAVFGFGRERKSRGAGPRGRVRGVRGGCVASREGTRGGGGSQAGRRWPGRVAARAGRVPVLLAEEEGDRGGRRRWAGPAGGAGQLGRLQVSGPGSLSLSLSFF